VYDTKFPADPVTLNDIAHDVDDRLGYTVYIPENGEYIPYLVLTNNYNEDGNCLLLRKHVLDEGMVFNIVDSSTFDIDGYISGYYENSHIDKFLNGEFLGTLSEIDDKIIDSEILITHIDSILVNGKETLVITRKVFLLSYTEVVGWEQLNAVEGFHIPYFKQVNRSLIFTRSDEEAMALRVATNSSGEPMSWWLRTPFTTDAHLVYGVSLNGGSAVLNIGGTEVTAFGQDMYKFSVRPAFCLPRDTPIYQGDIDGGKGYFLTLE
jgi:hypothetical protein